MALTSSNRPSCFYPVDLSCRLGIAGRAGATAARTRVRRPPRTAATSLRPGDKVAGWKKCDAASRFRDCLATLLLHGFLSGAEHDRALRRLAEWIDRHEEKARK